MTFFLLSESVAFYQAADTQNIPPLIKSLVEGFVDASKDTGKNWLKDWDQSVDVFGVSYMPHGVLVPHFSLSENVPSIQKTAFKWM